MPEYIEREALINRLLKVCMTDDLYGMGIQTGVGHAIDVIKEAPAADVTPPPWCMGGGIYTERIIAGPDVWLYCGIKYLTAPTAGRRWMQPMAKELCEDCGSVFEPKSNRGFVCKECHRKRLSKYAKERKLNKIGNEAYSKQCAERKHHENHQTQC